MKQRFILFFVLFLSMTIQVMGQKQNRGLIAFVNGNHVQVEWRMRSTDDFHNTQYLLYVDNALYGTYTTKTTVLLDKAKYENSTFSLVVKDGNNLEVDRQEGVKAWSCPCLDIALFAPVVKDSVADTAIVKYSPLDASAYDMDGDGEQEIVLKWGVSWVGKNTKSSDRREFVDCYKLNGTRLWRIDFGQNMVSGNNFTFMVWDFDGDGKGEMIVKTAPGTKDAFGNYVGEGLPGYPEDLEKIYYRGSDGAPTAGEEWITCFDGVSGKELASKQYWPYFGIQSDWNPGGSSDGKSYGRRGNGFKGAVIKIPCRDGQTRPVCFMQRGIYTYVYATAISWDGKKLIEEWRHSSTGKSSSVTENQTGNHKQSISLYAQGAHAGQAGDLDGDGYDEVCIGAAAIDHDGMVMWSTGLGHGDAIGVGDFNPHYKGLETWRITESATGYSACMINGRTGKVLNGQKSSGGDVNRGVIMDIDSMSVGTEYWHNASGNVFSCDGDSICTYTPRTNTGYPNFRIFWDGDLLDEHFDGQGVAKFDLQAHKWLRATFGRGNTTLLWKRYGVSNINGTKQNACLVCDLLGDFREELVMFASANRVNRTDCDFVLRVITTTYDTDKKLPWLRDDNTYNLQIASQNVGYSMPPHLGFNAYEWYKNGGKVYEDLVSDERKVFKPEAEASYKVATSADASLCLNLSATFSKGFAPCDASGNVVQFEYVTDSTYLFKNKDGRYLKASGNYGFAAVSTAADATPFIVYMDRDNVYFKSITNVSNNGKVWINYDSSRKAISRGASEDGAFRFYVLKTDTSTGILEVPVSERYSDEGWYNLQGMKVNPIEKGIYIHKGKKVRIGK